MSLGILLTIGAVVAGATTAYFNDSETSTENIFVAGSVDLKVDHTYASYNGEECIGECNVEVYSNTQHVTDEGFAVETWEHDNWVDYIPGSPAVWIWTDYYVDNPLIDETQTFTKDFLVGGPVSEAMLDIAADNGYKVEINGIVVVDLLDEEFNYNAVAQHHNIETELFEGMNTIVVTVKNFALPDSVPESNPAGLLYRLQVRSNCGGEYTNTPGAMCELWLERNIDTEQFFNFDDVKPGDHGRDVISLHVDENDSYACLLVHEGVDLENTLLDPEEEYGDVTDSLGELSGYINVFMWRDLDADGMYDPAGETSIYENGIDGLTTDEIVLIGNGPTTYYGLAWCAGDMTVNHSNGEIGCDGHGMHDDAQSDMYTASLTAFAEQTRHNEGFTCGDVLLVD